MSSNLKYIISFVFAAVLLVAVQAYAVWQDAPAAPAQYGTTPGTTQDDYKPVNLGDTTQTKTGGLNILGNVGIGTESPYGNLEVRGSGNTGGLIVGGGITNYNMLTIGATAKAFPKDDGTSNDWSANGAFWAMPMIYRSIRYPNSGSGTFPDNQYGELILQGTSHGGGYNKGISFVTWDGTPADPAIRMRIKEDGNVGIGTVTPYAKLQVDMQNLATTEGLHISRTSPTSYSYLNIEDENSSPIFKVHQSGNVGIGTTAPGYKLSVAGDISATRLCIADNCKADWASVGGVTSITAGAGLYSATNPITTSGTISLDLTKANTWTGTQTFSGGANFPGSGAWDASGNATIGGSVTVGGTLTAATFAGPSRFSVTPGSKTYGSLRIDGSGGGYSGIYFADDDRTFMVDSQYQGIFQEGVGWQWYWNNGTLEQGIIPWARISGAPSASTPNLQAVTDVGYTTDKSITAAGFNVSSDARLKKNVETLSGALDKIGRARGVSYDLVSGTSARQIGVIAQELEQEFPELVVTDGNGYKAVAYDRLSAVLIEAVKELKSQNQALQSRLDLLEKKW